jgi:hypothetical protein
MDENITEDWALYQAGKNYNNKLSPNYYDTVDANLAFFNDDQWRNLKAEKMPKPVFNIIKRVTSFFVASLTSSKISTKFEPFLYSDVEQNDQMKMELDAAKMADAQVEKLFEKFKMDFRIKDALFDAAITGDACAHFYFDVNQKPYGGSFSDIKGEIAMELVDGTNVFFGNANTTKTDAQPYIIISGRDMVKNLQEEAKRYKEESENIQEDNSYEYMAGDAGKIEVEADEYGKALYIIVYRYDKKTGTVKVSKSVENAYIYKNIDTGLKHYPIAWLNWEKQKNQYHGKALCTGMLPNQIFINRMFAMVMYHLMMTAFPKAVYNADMITSWNNEIGAAIPIRGVGPEQNIKNIAGYLDPASMSNNIIEVIDYAMQYTKETLGISDAALGNVDPKNTSAIIAVQKSSAIPLENPRSNLYEWVEDIGRILFDMMGTYYGQRPVVLEEEGQKVVKPFDFAQLKDLWLDVKVDVGESSYWSELASVETLDRLLLEGQIELLDYLERVPDEYIPQKQDLISKIEQRVEQQQMMMQQQQTEQQPTPGQQQAPPPQGADIEQLIAQLSPEDQEAFYGASPETQQEILNNLLG